MNGGGGLRRNKIVLELQDLRNVAGRVAGFGIDGYAHQVVAGAVDQVAVGIDLEIATAGVIGDAGEDRHVVDHGARLLHREEAVTVDCHVGGNRCRRDGALGGDRGLGEGGDAAGNLPARRRGVRNEILEAGADALVAGGRGVRDILCRLPADTLEKTRHRLLLGDRPVAVDVFADGLVLLEVGFDSDEAMAAFEGDCRKRYANMGNIVISAT